MEDVKEILIVVLEGQFFVVEGALFRHARRKDKV
jgi:hypothetical protein